VTRRQALQKFFKTLGLNAAYLAREPYDTFEKENTAVQHSHRIFRNGHRLGITAIA